MSQEWYYAQGGVQHGPITSDEIGRLLTSGQLQPDNLVWREGMSQWAKAATVEELRPLLPPEGSPRLSPSETPPKSSTPPLSRPTFPVAPASTGSASRAKSRPHIAVLKSLLRITVGVVGILVVGGSVMVALVHMSINREADRSPEQVQKADAAHLGQSNGTRVASGTTTKRDLPPASVGMSIPEKTQSTADKSLDTRQVLSADFCPIVPGRKWRTRGVLMEQKLSDGIEGGINVENEYSEHDDNTIRIRQLKCYLRASDGSGATDIKDLPLAEDKTEHYRIHDGFVEVGTEFDLGSGRKETNWSPIIKIGATEGEIWERKQALAGWRDVYTLKNFETLSEPLAEKLSSSKPVLAAVVENRMLNSKNEPTVIVETTLVRGWGIYDVRAYTINRKGEKERRRWEHVVAPMSEVAQGGGSTVDYPETGTIGGFRYPVLIGSVDAAKDLFSDLPFRWTLNAPTAAGDNVLEKWEGVCERQSCTIAITLLVHNKRLVQVQVILGIAGSVDDQAVKAFVDISCAAGTKLTGWSECRSWITTALNKVAKTKGDWKDKVVHGGIRTSVIHDQGKMIIVQFAPDEMLTAGDK